MSKSTDSQLVRYVPRRPKISMRSEVFTMEYEAAIKESWLHFWRWRARLCTEVANSENPQKPQMVHSSVMPYSCAYHFCTYPLVNVYKTL